MSPSHLRFSFTIQRTQTQTSYGPNSTSHKVVNSQIVICIRPFAGRRALHLFWAEYAWDITTCVRHFLQDCPFIVSLVEQISDPSTPTDPSARPPRKPHVARPKNPNPRIQPSRNRTLISSHSALKRHLAHVTMRPRLPIIDDLGFNRPFRITIDLTLFLVSLWGLERSADGFVDSAAVSSFNPLFPCSSLFFPSLVRSRMSLSSYFFFYGLSTDLF